MLLQCGLNVAPMVLGFILGKIVESNFRTAIISSQGSFHKLFTSPLAMGMIVFGLFMAFAFGRKKKTN